MPTGLPVVRFYRGSEIIGSAEASPGVPLVDVAEQAGIEIPTNCTSGNCGTCLVRLIRGEVGLPEVLPPGLDEDLVSEGGILTCCISPLENCDIDVKPPL